MPSIEFDMENAPDIPAFNPDAHASHGLDLDTSYNPFDTAPSGKKESSVSRSVHTDWEKLYEDFARNRDESYAGISESAIDAFPSEELPEDMPDPDFSGDFDNSLPGSMQLKGRYILAPSKNGLMVVDQHRAHVRILYDRYLDLARLDALATQRIIFPEVVELSPSQSSVMESISDELVSLGFDVAFLGGTSWSVNGLPSVLDSVNPHEILLSMVDCVTETGEELGESLRNRIALSMARAAAIKPGAQLTDAEMEHLLSDLFKLSAPGYTPDGKTVMSIIAFDDIVRLFA